MTDPDLTLQEAADALGVHYMTAYRYVRLGLLDAVRLGGTWRLKRPDVEAFRSSAVASLAGDPSSGGRRRAPWAERLEARLIAGDGRGGWGVIEGALSAGADLEDLYVDVVSPALTAIGERWASGAIDVSVEHRASVIAMRLIARLGPRFARRGRTRGLVVLGAPAGEQHVLGLSMLADLIRQRGWEVSDLGADVPAESFGAAVLAGGDEVIAVGMSVSTAPHLTALMEAIGTIRAVAPGTCVVVGGQAFESSDHALSLGADRFAGTARGIDAVLESLPPH